MTAAVDPIELEIIRHRLDATAVDAGETLVRVSGSQIASEGSDYNVSIMDADGTVIACSKFIVVQSIALNLIVTDLLKRYADNPGVNPGDQFLTNDPYLGALHQPDVAVLAPVFHQGKMVAWVGCTVHEADIGGPVAGGFNQASRSIFDEPLPIAPVKIVENGVVRRDIERDYLARSRTPELNALDLMGQIAANRIAGERITELCDRYGADTFAAAMAQLVDRTEAAFKGRLSQLPDGAWRDVSYLEHERKVGDDFVPNAVYAVRLTMTKSGDTLVLDFSESDDQAAGSINCAYPALANFTMAAVLIQLCNGLTWVPGAIWRAIKIVSRPGSIAHAKWPAGCVGSPAAGGQAVRNVVCGCIARMLDASEKHSDWAMAYSQSTGGGGGGLHGVDGEGRSFHTMFLDVLSGGGGATRFRDGTDVSGTSTSIGATPTNVETNEAAFPVLYMARRELPDSAGPGFQRGGVSALWSYRPHGTPEAISMQPAGVGLQHPSTLGAAGGEPGFASGYAVVDHLDEPHLDWATLGADFDPEPSLAVTRIGLGQMLIGSAQGGGGFGDPIERDPNKVVEDVLDGLVSEQGAARDYAVVVRREGDKVSLDPAATAALRVRRRTERLQGRAPRPRDYQRQGQRISSAFERVGEGRDAEVRCAGCGVRICDGDAPIHEALVVEDKPVGARLSLTNRYPGAERFRVRHFYCPGCAAQVDVQVVQAGEALRNADERPDAA